MERIILFRGKRTDGKGWVYGDLNQNPVHHDCCILENGVINNSVIRKTVGQFTGLKDKNGRKIFEGDKLKTPENSFCNVVWEDAGFALFSEGSEAVDWEHSTYFEKCEVIGNIHEE